MPHYTHTEQVNASPADVFAIIQNTDRTPEWLKRCTAIDRLEEGETREGLPLRYHYKDGNRTGVMAGTVSAFEAGRRMTMSFTDKITDVSVDFETADGATPGTTSLTHTIDIRTKGLGKMFTPMINKALPRQTLDAMTNLKALAES